MSEFKLVEQKEQAPLKNIIESMMGADAKKYAAEEQGRKDAKAAQAQLQDDEVKQM